MPFRSEPLLSNDSLQPRIRFAAPQTKETGYTGLTGCNVLADENQEPKPKLCYKDAEKCANGDYDDGDDWPSRPLFPEVEGDPSVAFVHSAVFFPDYTLLLLNPVESNVSFFSPLRKVPVDNLQCVYDNKLVTKAIAAGDGSIQCAHPPLERRAALWGKKVTLQISGQMMDSVAAYARNFWQILVYKMVLFEEDDEVLLFAKGVAQMRESEATGISCLFGTRLKTPVVSSCEENFRCKLPEASEDPDLVGEVITLEVAGKSLPSVVRWYPPVHGINKVLEEIRGQKSMVAHAIDVRNEKHDICVCTMVWNVAKFMKEWVMYHSHMGVTRFFIYDNNSDDDLEKVIESLQYYNVSQHPWPWIKTQEAGFGHCAITAGPECNWIVFIDVDEFIFPQKVLGLQNEAGTPLQLLLQEYNDAFDGRLGQLKLPLFNFGPSRLTTLPRSGQAVNYVCRLAAPKRVKSMVRVEAMTSTVCNRVHFFEIRQEFSQARVRKGSAMIYHYKYPVWEDFQYKFVRRVSAAVPDWTDNERLESTDRAPGLGTEPIQPKDWPERFCDVEDTALRDYVIRNFRSGTSDNLLWE